MAELMNKADWRIVIHEAEEGGHWGEVPAMPGCVSEGETVEECRANVLEAAKGCFEAYSKMVMEKSLKVAGYEYDHTEGRHLIWKNKANQRSLSIPFYCKCMKQETMIGIVNALRN